MQSASSVQCLEKVLRSYTVTKTEDSSTSSEDHVAGNSTDNKVKKENRKGVCRGEPVA